MDIDPLAASARTTSGRHPESIPGAEGSPPTREAWWHALTTALPPSLLEFLEDGA